MEPQELNRFVEKYRLAQELALRSYFDGGVNGLEVEWNVTNEALRPLHHVGAGPDARSFVEVLRDRFVPPWLAGRNDLEVFHWMTEWITRPYYHPVGSVYEARVLEACLLNAINAAGLSFGERLFAWHGNVLWPIDVDHNSIPGAWELSKRRYLARCVDLFGTALATAGVHANVSLPEPLFSFDLLGQPADQRAENSLVAMRNAAYIRGARVLRAFAALFVATSASSPLRGEWHEGKPVVRCTDTDSNRVAWMPNPPELDQPFLYRSHADYLRISSDLVRRRIRFGNNNWTPTRARSDPTAVANIIHMTSDQIHELCRMGIYGVGEHDAVEQLAQRIEVENMLARVELPMARVEIRSDEGGHSLALDMGNLVFKQLLLLRAYADPEFGAGFDYAEQDIRRVRHNEQVAAEHGLRGQMQDPFSGRTVDMRAFLRWGLAQVQPLGTALGWHHYLEPLQVLASGGANTAEQIRQRLRPHCRTDQTVALEALQELLAERAEQINHDVQHIVERLGDLGEEAPKLRDLLFKAGEQADHDPSAAIRFQPRAPVRIEHAPADTTAEIVELAQQLIRIPSVTNCPNERLSEVFRAARFIAGYLQNARVQVRLFDQGKYPAVLAHFPGQLFAPVMLAGHFDVVEPAPDDGQFVPVIDGDYLWGRGAADMKTVVATYLVWMRDVLRDRPECFPPINLLLVGNEENGEAEPFGTPHVLAELEQRNGYRPELLVAGERTGETGQELFGEICVENRGVVRLDFVAHGVQEHTGVGARVADLGARIVAARQDIAQIVERYLTLSDPGGWTSDYRFSFLTVGKPGVYNITADTGHLGLEVRPIPQDDSNGLLGALSAYAGENDLEVRIQTREPGVACDRDNPYLGVLIEAVRQASGTEPRLSRKKPGTSARFAPPGTAVVWGQSGIGPHAPAERHYIPSIPGYYQALQHLARLAADLPTRSSA